jgi:hypothetical protein
LPDLEDDQLQGGLQAKAVLGQPKGQGKDGIPESGSLRGLVKCGPLPHPWPTHQATGVQVLCPNPCLEMMQFNLNSNQ